MSTTERRIEIGHRCGHEGCTGRFEFRLSDSCSCHISPPCHHCVEDPLVCDECGREEGEE